MMHGGTAVNIVPQDCEIVWEFRAVEGDDGSDIKQRVQEFIDTDLLPRMRAVAPGADIVTEPIAEVVGLFPEKDGPAETLIKLLAQRNDTETVSYGTEGGVFQVAGISTVVCGPGDIAVAHQPNEFVDVDQISQCMDLMGPSADPYLGLTGTALGEARMMVDFQFGSGAVLRGGGEQ